MVEEYLYEWEDVNKFTLLLQTYYFSEYNFGHYKLQVSSEMAWRYRRIKKDCLHTKLHATIVINRVNKLNLRLCCSQEL